jgi:DNA-binding PadR family transcriptional regulator
MTPHTRTVLRVLLGRGTDVDRRAVVLADGIYGLELTRQTGLPNGTLFPVLERLVRYEWVERYWERDESAEAEGRPRRRYYRITKKGAELAALALDTTAPESAHSRRTPTTGPGLAGRARSVADRALAGFDETPGTTEAANLR